jgi:hypothetical protein
VKFELHRLLAANDASTGASGALGANRKGRLTMKEDPMDDDDAAKTDDTSTAPAVQLIDPFARYGELESGDHFEGDFVKLDQKKGWIRGEQKTPLDTEAWVANMREARHGWIKYQEDGPPIRRLVRIMEQPELPPRPEDDGWNSVVYLPLRSLANPEDVVVFTGGGQGARTALGRLCKVYARTDADRHGKDPVVALEQTKPFNNKAGGTTIWPIFRWLGAEHFVPDVPAPPVQAIAVPIEPPAKLATKALLPKRGDMDDDIPF